MYTSTIILYYEKSLIKAVYIETKNKINNFLFF